MPMSEALQQALIDSNTSVDQLADLLHHDGLNCRESETYDTPLILAIRHHNFPAVEYILSLAHESADRDSILHAVNHLNETPLTAALKHEDDKRLALLLISYGVELESGVSEDIPDSSKQFLSNFIEFQQLNSKQNLTASDHEKMGKCKYAIGLSYEHELHDTASAMQWYESAAHDGNQQSMQLIAAHYLEMGDMVQAIEWYKRCFAAATSSNERDNIIVQLRSIASTQSHNQDAAYSIAMAIGSAFAASGDIEQAISCFANAEDSYHALSEQNENDSLFFKACSIWSGPSVDRNIGMLDCLDYTTRIILLIHSNTENSQHLLAGLAASNKSILSQLITCHLCKEAGILSDAQLEPLDNPKNQTFLEALSFLYGWNGKPKNTLRGASLLKKLITNTNNDDNFMAYSLIAFAYLQQETEHDVYVVEAFNALDNAHACLGSQDSPRRKEIINTILDGLSYA